jgi:hypothetical protein
MRMARKTSTHYFSCSGGLDTDSTKSAPGHVMPNLSFQIRLDLWVMSCILLHPGHETSTQYISCSGGPGTDSTKSATGQTHDAKLVFLHLMGSVGTYCIPVCAGCETSTHYFSFSDGPGSVSMKCVLGHVTLNMCFCILWDMRIT